MSKQAFGNALRDMRYRRQLTQEDFSQVSSRTYLSTLERGMYSPTLDKIDELASVLQVHPLSLVALYHLNRHPDTSLDQLLQTVRQDLSVEAGSLRRSPRKNKKVAVS